METYTMSYEIKVWRVIKKENFPIPPKKDENGQVIVSTDPLDLYDYTEEQSAIIIMNGKEKHLMYNAISGEEYEKISSYKTAKEMWDKLEVTYEGTNKLKETRINLLVRDYKLFQMKDEESVEEIFSRFSKILGDLKSFGRPIKSGEHVRKILRSLPTIWQPKIIALECQDLDIISYDELRGDLIAFEKTHSDRNSRRGKSNFRKGRMNNDNYKNDGRCYECGKHGHIQAECPELKKKLSRNFQKKKSFGAWSDEEEFDHEEIAVKTQVQEQQEMDLKQFKKNKKGKWYLDSACSRNMTGDKQLFKTVTKLEGGTVTFGDKSKGNVIGVGRVPLNSTCDVEEVYLVDELGYNLLGISQLCDNDYEMIFLVSLGLFSLNHKDEALRNFEVFCKKVQRDKGYYISTIISDHGGDFGSRAFENFCNDQGISHNFSSPRSPQQNGVVECKNRNLQNMARTMIVENSLSHHFWAEVVDEALKDDYWVKVMKDELDQFERNKVWDLVPKPSNASIVGTKCVFINKLNESGQVVRKKARLVAQGYSQQEGTDYDKTFAPVARLESIRILLVFAAHKGFKLFQINVKSAFLNGYISEELYVKQPPGFYMLESIRDISSSTVCLPHGLLISHILEVMKVDLAHFSPKHITSTYDKTAFALMGYTLSDDSWVKRAKVESAPVQVEAPTEPIEPQLTATNNLQ
ncbi:uncharacterized protein LOC142166947 [Nicotiana tabacum]|uniref:Uncharacterized protein LOC142166947 n=1 Tax=Nicotiana tabacum TaxID=4097 RepID=A0AC58SDC7_TOBAC